MQTRFVPQLAPGALLPPSTQVSAPVAHEVVPALHAFGLPEQAWPAVHEMHPPEPSQTMLVPQPVPADLFVPSTQACPPDAHDVVPTLQAPGFVAQATPAVHATQVAEALHTMLAPQLVPGALTVPSTHIGDPAVHEATPLAQALGLPEQL